MMNPSTITSTEEFFKGCKNAYFKYAGDGIDFCKPLYRAGLLTHDTEKIGGCGGFSL